MDRYLTNKARKAQGWELPAAIFSLLLGGIGVKACLETYDPEDPFVWLTASLLVMALILLPLCFALRASLRRRMAKKIALALARRRSQDEDDDETEDSNG